MTLRRSMFTVVALAIGILGSEILCRAFFPSPFAGRSIATGMLYHPRWGVTHEPGASYRSQNPADKTDFAMEINSLGFRGPEIPELRGDTFRIVFMGDSFTEGYGVEVEDGLVAQSELRFREHDPEANVEVVNTGIRGGSPSTYRLQLERNLSLAPDGLVLVAYDNDLADDFYYSFDWDHLRADVYSEIRRLPFESRLIEMLGELVVRAKQNLAVARAEAIVGGTNLRADTYTFGTGKIEEDPLGFYARLDLWEVHWERTREYLSQIAGEARANGVEFAIVYIPGPQSGIHGDCCTEVYPPEAGRCPGAYSPFGEWLRGFAEEWKLPFIDVHEAFVQLEEAGDPDPVYEIANGHLNARGNGIVADLVHETLRDWIRE